MHDQLVLVCPACQESSDWTAELERCAKCRSAHLIRRLGQVECLDCGLVREPDASLVLAAAPNAAGRASAANNASPVDATLADEVGRALDRLLGRT
jgi:hypothetical protein